MGGRACGTRLVAGVVGVMLGMTGAHAADAGKTPNQDAGTLLRQIESRPVEIPERREVPLPARRAPDAPQERDSGVRIFPERFRLQGVSIFPDDEILKLLEPYTGKRLTAAQLQLAVSAVTEFYQSRGYIASFAYLPRQKFDFDGKPMAVTIAVLEGRYDNIIIKNASRVSDFVLRKTLALREGAHVSLGPLEQALNLIDELPGAVVVGSNFKPGMRTGTTDYELTVGPAPALKWSLMLDNHGVGTTGHNRGTVMAAWQSPLGVGDALDVFATSSGPGLSSGRLGYSVLVGFSGARLGASASRVQYRLLGEFKDLDYYGTADAAALDLSIPLVRDKLRSMTLKTSLETKSLKDTTFVAGNTETKRIDSINIALNGDSADSLGGGGKTSWRHGVTVGRLTMTNALAQEKVDAGVVRDGKFARYNPEVVRLQSIGALGGLIGMASLRGQYARKNLDGSEKMSLGGPNDLRAYPVSEMSGDVAWYMGLELMKQLPRWEGLNSSVSVFYDWGKVLYSANPSPGADNTQVLRDAGVGFRLDFKDQFFMNSSLAWPIGGRSQSASEADKIPRIWVMLGVKG